MFGFVGMVVLPTQTLPVPDFGMGNMDSDSYGAPVHQRRTCHRRGFEQLHLRKDFGSWFPLPQTEVPRTVWYSCVLHLDAF